MLAITLILLAGACGNAGTPSDTTSPSPSPASSPTVPSSPSPADPSSPPSPLAEVRIRLVQVASLEQPLAMAVRAGDTALYVAQKTGKVVAIRAGRTVDKVPVVDLSDDVSLGSEQGLLGLAFSPGGDELYVNYTDTSGDTHVTGFAMRGDRVDPATRRDILVVDQPYSNHNGGNLVFGPDGFLYVGLGDGGSGGDPHGNGQSLSTPLGKMLRIDPQFSGDRPYRIPADNPFVGRPDARPAIWAYGLRNPWRYSFDRLTGDLWIGDVGQNAWEEIDRQPSGSPGGENYGWNLMEGSHPFAGDAPAEAVRPVFEYSQDGGGCTVIGGYVYRGEAIPDLDGAYLFGDLCIGQIEAIRVRDGRVVGHRALGPEVPNLSSFGEDADGELYAMSLSGGLYRIAAGS
jgi:glucose/arabinose dehydrogenase